MRVPVLRKDFILDEVQILEARAAGAAAVLLIVRALAPRGSSLCCGSPTAQGLDALVEVHTEGRAEAALEAGAAIIGVNSRDLDTFRIDIAAAWKLLSEVPADLRGRGGERDAAAEDVERPPRAGADAVLVGTALSAAAAPETLLEPDRECSPPWPLRPRSAG